MVSRKALVVALALLPPTGASLLTREVYRRPAEVKVDFERAYEGGFVSGFHAREREGTRAFRWTTGESSVRFENLPVGGKLEVEVRLKAFRPAGQPLPFLRFTADGATVFQTPAFPGEVGYRFTVPLRSSSLSLGIHSDTFVARDSRTLGVQLLSIRLRSQGGKVPLTPPIAWMALGAALLLGAGRAAGVSFLLSSMVAAVLSAGFVYLLAQDSVRFLPYPRQVALLAGLTLAAALILRAILTKAGWPHPAERPALVAVLAGSFLLKLGGLFYPLFVSSDADFQANRLSEVLQGNFFPTSFSQHDPPFRIPYPVSLYLLAAPWAAMGLDRVRVLQVLAALADVGVGLALAYLARRFWNDTRAGVLAAALYQILPLNFLAFSSGNLTNLFGVAATVFFLAGLLALAAGGGWRAAATTFLFSLLALTAHFGTFLCGLLLWPVWVGALFGIAPEGFSPRRPKLLLGTITASAALALVYYAGYRDLFAGQLGRALGQDYATGGTEVIGALAKLAFNLSFLREQVGVVFGLLVLAGAVPVLLKATATPLHLAAAVWTGATALFFLLDLTTAIEVRYLLQASPLMALFAGKYLSGAFSRGRLGRLAAVATLSYLSAVGLASFDHCLLYRYH